MVTLQLYNFSCPTILETEYASDFKHLQFSWVFSSIKAAHVLVFLFQELFYCVLLNHPKWKLWLSNKSRVLKCIQNSLSTLNSWPKKFSLPHSGSREPPLRDLSSLQPVPLCLTHEGSRATPHMSSCLQPWWGQGFQIHYPECVLHIVIIPGTSVAVLHTKHLDWFWRMLTHLHPLINYFSTRKQNSLKSSVKPSERK